MVQRANRRDFETNTLNTELASGKSGGIRATDHRNVWRDYLDSAENLGARGPEGPRGPQGPTGTNGTNGRDGTDGAPGQDGARGPQGPAGNDGQRGPQGPQGNPGNDGATGARGPQGPQGNPGNDGARGPAGPTGANGTDGTNGNNGWTAVYAIVNSGERRILRLDSWIGGSGALPSQLNNLVGQYVGPTGYVSNAANAVNIRGPAGSGSGGGGTGTPGTNGDFWVPIFRTLNSGDAAPATPNASNPTYISSTRTVNFGTLSSGWSNQSPGSAINARTQRIWWSWVRLAFSSDNSSISVITTTAPQPFTGIDGGGTTPTPTGDFAFSWREGASGAFTEIANRQNDVPFDFNPEVTTNGSTSLVFRVPDTHRITSIQAGLAGVYGGNQINEWVMTTGGGFNVWTNANLIGPGTFNFRITAGAV